MKRFLKQKLQLRQIEEQGFFSKTLIQQPRFRDDLRQKVPLQGVLLQEIRGALPHP